MFNLLKAFFKSDKSNQKKSFVDKSLSFEEYFINYYHSDFCDDLDIWLNVMKDDERELLSSLFRLNDIHKVVKDIKKFQGVQLQQSDKWRQAEKREELKKNYKQYHDEMCLVVDYLDSVKPTDTGNINPNHTAFDVSKVTLMPEFYEVLENLVRDFTRPKSSLSKVFPSIAYTMRENLLKVSNQPLHITDEEFTKRKLVYPTDPKKKFTHNQAIEHYVKDTPFYDYFNKTLPFTLTSRSPNVRFEHTHVLGGSGHGKTQLLSLLLKNDIEDVKAGLCGFAVIDSQGDLIRSIAELDLFNPNVPGSLSEKLIIIDPADTEFPLSLSLFDIDLTDCVQRDKERIINQAVELYAYVFGSLMGAEMTSKQRTMFDYVLALMIEIPGSNIHTLKRLLEEEIPTEKKKEQPDPKKSEFYKYFVKLGDNEKDFFLNYFFRNGGDSFQQNKRQVLNRILGILKNSAVAKIFESRKNKINIFNAMNEGKIILINTNKEALTTSYCSLIGRFFIAIFAQAALKRSLIREENRLPFYLYIDECQDYLDEYAENLFNQARKYKLGLTVAHQNTGQLQHSLRDSINASTAIKMVGGANYKDASGLAKEMRTSSEFVQSMAKEKTQTNFACFIKNTTPTAIKLSVPFGVLSKLPKMGASDFDLLLKTNKLKYMQDTEVMDDLPTAEPEQENQGKEPIPEVKGFKLGKHRKI